MFMFKKKLFQIFFVEAQKTQSGKTKDTENGGNGEIQNLFQCVLSACTDPAHGSSYIDLVDKTQRLDKGFVCAGYFQNQ